PFHLSEVPNFLAQLHPASITDCDIYIAICNLCQDLYRPCFKELRRTSREDNKKAPGFWSGGRHGFPLISPTSQHQAEIVLLLTRVVLVAIDLVRLAVQLAVHFGAFLRRELAAVCGPVILHFVMDLLLVPFQVRSLPRRQLSALHAIGNAILLVFHALAYFTFGTVHGSGRGILSNGRQRKNRQRCAQESNLDGVPHNLFPP